MDLDFFFLFNINQIIEMKRKRNGAEIKSMRPDDVLFPFIPHAKLHPQINYSAGDREGLEKRGKWRRRAAHKATALRRIFEELLKSCGFFF